MAQTNLYIGKTTNNAGESEISMRLYISRDIRIRVSSGIWVDHKRWGKKNEINIPIILGEERQKLLEKRGKLKSLIDFLENSINTAYDKNIINKAFIEKEIKKFHKPEKKILPTSPTETIFDVMEKYLSVHKLSESRKKNFRVIIRSLRRFELFKGRESKKNFKLSFSNLFLETLQEIEEFLGNEKEVFLKYPEIYDIIPYSSKVAYKTVPRKRPLNIDENGNEIPKGIPKERGKNSVADMLIRFRSFIKWANLNDYTTNDPFKHFIIGEVVYGSPVYITNEERNKLLNTDLSDDVELETQRDIFVFQCMIGCRVSDLYKMTYANIIGDCIEYVPRKTRDDRVVTVSVPLIGAAKELIRKYLDENRGTLFPFISEQKYNVYIKAAFRKAGLTRMVTTIDQRTRQNVQVPICDLASSHMARRTFIGNVYKSVKDPAIVGAMSGHKDGSRAFARYRDIDMDIKRDAVSVLE